MYILFAMVLINIIIREYLELNAVIRSKDLFLEYVKKLVNKEEENLLRDYFFKEINKAKYLYFFKILFNKFLPFLIIVLIKFFMF